MKSNYLNTRYRQFYILIHSKGIRTGSILLILLFISEGCNKLVQIPAPSNSITTPQVFMDSVEADAGIAGIYSNVQQGGNVGFCNGTQTIYCSLSADELVSAYSQDPQIFYLNELVATNGSVESYFWLQGYNYIYQANAAIEALQASSGLPTSVKNRFTGEAKFMRALFYFYLVNLFGDVPYVNSTSWAKTAPLSRASIAEVYQAIVADLKDAQQLLPTDYSFSDGLRTRANQWAATALLARVYLYTGDWSDAETQASALINNSGVFSLATDLANVFSTTSTEAILQWQLNTSFGSYDATPEGIALSPLGEFFPANYYLSMQLLQSFEPGDKRRDSWINSDYSGTHYYPYKYKIAAYLRNPGGAASEYYTVLRLGEQYLIRAEAAANGAGSGLTEAIADLNSIRQRAGLGDYSGPVDNKDSVLAAIMHERRVELFAEWGHRWLDLKRTGQVDAVMSVATPQKNGGGAWQSYQQWYPIPSHEIQTDPNLTQNAGY